MPRSRIQFHREAGAEYDAAFDWYLKRNPDAALRFDSEVCRALEQIAHAPERWTAGPFNTHRFLLRQFPYMLIYRKRTSREIQVLALAHTSRNPGYWKNRI